MIFIILVNWNGWPYTIECLKSLKKLANANLQIVVVDNGSTDKSLEILQSFTPEITFINTKKNLGFGAGNNVGIHYALDHKAEYIWLLNNDTIVSSNTLSALKDFMDKNPKIGLVGSVIYNIINRNKLQTYGGYKLNRLRCYVLPCKINEQPDFITGTSMFIRRQVFIDTGYFDEKYFMYWEDADFSLRTKQKGWQIGVANSSIVYHMEGASSSSSKKEYYSLISGLYFSWKYSNCFIYTFLVGFLFDRIIKRLLLFPINLLIAKNNRPSCCHKKPEGPNKK